MRAMPTKGGGEPPGATPAASDAEQHAEGAAADTPAAAATAAAGAPPPPPAAPSAAELRALFDSFDADRNGQLELQEVQASGSAGSRGFPAPESSPPAPSQPPTHAAFAPLRWLQAALQALGLPASQRYMGELLSQYDRDASRCIDFDEFRGYVEGKEKRIRAVFARIDGDGDGALDAGEVHRAARALGLSVAPEEAERMVGGWGGRRHGRRVVDAPLAEPPPGAPLGPAGATHEPLHLLARRSACWIATATGTSTTQSSDASACCCPVSAPAAESYAPLPCCCLLSGDLPELPTHARPCLAA